MCEVDFHGEQTWQGNSFSIAGISINIIGRSDTPTIVLGHNPSGGGQLNVVKLKLFVSFLYLDSVGAMATGVCTHRFVAVHAKIEANLIKEHGEVIEHFIGGQRASKAPQDSKSGASFVVDEFVLCEILLLSPHVSDPTKHCVTERSCRQSHLRNVATVCHLNDRGKGVGWKGHERGAAHSKGSKGSY